MLYRCGHCQARISLPLQRHETSCPACRRPILVNPEKPILNFWFLFLLVIFAAPTVTTLLDGHWSAMEMLSASTALLIPLGVYLLMVHFSGIERLYAGKKDARAEPGLGAGAPPPASSWPRDTAVGAELPMVGTTAPQPSRLGELLGFALILAFIAAYIAWVYVYLVMLRPRLNEWLAQYIGSIPMILHFLPLIGLPILLIALGVGVWNLGRWLLGVKKTGRREPGI